MPNYAIIRTGGKQHRVRPGDTVLVERLSGEVGDVVELTDVLMTSVDGQFKVGAPVVENAAVAAEITGHPRARKVTVFHYKSKTRQRRKRGHRQGYTELRIKDIVAG